MNNELQNAKFERLLLQANLNNENTINIFSNSNNLFYFNRL